MYKIEKLWAFVADNPGDEEGIIATGIEGLGLVTLITSRRYIAEQMVEKALAVCATEGRTFKVLEFSVRKDVTQEFTDGHV